MLGLTANKEPKRYAANCNLSRYPKFIGLNWEEILSFISDINSLYLDFESIAASGSSLMQWNMIPLQKMLYEPLASKQWDEFSRQIVSWFNKLRDRKCDNGLLVLDMSKSCISTDVDGRYSDTEKTNSAVIEAYRMSRDFAVVCPEVEHCVFQVSLFTFFFLALFLQRRILLGKRKCLHSEVNSPPRSIPTPNQTHTQTHSRWCFGNVPKC